MRLIDADTLVDELLKHSVVTDDLFGMGRAQGARNALTAICAAPTIDAVPVVRGEWVYAISKGSCMDWHVTAKCSECGWDWFSKGGIGNPGHVFGAFITNGDSKPDETKAFLLENAKSNNGLRFCPNCGTKMEDKP